jgi:chemosensory pili system protein ChpA (sensor histidine kinase/response regulator)
MLAGTMTMPTILLVEDSMLLRTANQHILTRAGYTVMTAGDGEEALHLVRQHRPGLVILDLMLPKLGGELVLQALQKDATTARIPVIVLSSLSQMNEQKLCQAGASAFLEKDRLTDKPRGLLDTIEQVLKVRSDRREA